MNEFRLPMEYNWELAHKKIAKTEYYTLDYSAGNTVEVSTLKGIIDITNFSGSVPDPAFLTFTSVFINNPKLLLTDGNKDNIYIQITPYYKWANNDNFIPYVMASGVNPGVEFNIFNANPAPSGGVDQGAGEFYLYFELYTK